MCRKHNKFFMLVRSKTNDVLLIKTPSRGFSEDSTTQSDWKDQIDPLYKQKLLKKTESIYDSYINLIPSAEIWPCANVFQKSQLLQCTKNRCVYNN